MRVRLALAVLATALGATLTGCAGNLGEGAEAGVATTAASPSASDATGPSSRLGDGVSCNGFEIAPPIDKSQLLGTWSYDRSTLYQGGFDFGAVARGQLVLDADGRWDGSRAIVTGDGTGNYPTAHGPGGWSFDGRTLDLVYDDGSDMETYTGVRVWEQTDDNGIEYLVMQLEVATEDGCTVTILERQL